MTTTGESASRTRRRRMRSTALLLRAVAGEKIAYEDGDASRLLPRWEALSYLLWRMALGGNLTACRLLLEYMEGKPGQRAAEARDPADLPELTADDLARAEAALAEWRAAHPAADPTPAAAADSTPAAGRPARARGPRRRAGRAAPPAPEPHEVTDGPGTTDEA